MDLMVCVGSSCHLKGSATVISELKKIIDEKNLNDEIILKGSFCMGECGSDGVCVKFNEKYFFVKPNEVAEFFKKEVLEGGCL